MTWLAWNAFALTMSQRQTRPSDQKARRQSYTCPIKPWGPSFVRTETLAFISNRFVRFGGRPRISSEEEEEEQEIQNLLSDFPVLSGLQTNVRIKKRSKMLPECLMDGLIGNLYLHFRNEGRARSGSNKWIHLHYRGWAVKMDPPSF